MSGNDPDGTPTAPGNEVRGYRPPTITRLGSLADLTQVKDVGAADGTTFLGVDLGSV